MGLKYKPKKHQINRLGVMIILLIVQSANILFCQGSDAFNVNAPNILFNPTTGDLTSATKEISSCGFGASITSSGVTGFSNNYLFSCAGSTCSASNSNDNETDFIDLWYKVILPTGTTQMTVLLNGLQTNEFVSFSIYTGNPGTSNSTNLIPFSTTTTINGTANVQGGLFSVSKTSNAINGLTAGGTYYLRIMSVQADANGTCATILHPDFTIEVQAPQANDVCTNAINITTNNSGTTHTGNYTAALSEGTDEWNSCPVSTKTAAKDLWYRINYPSATAGTVFLSELTISGTTGQTVRVIVYHVTYGCGSNPTTSEVAYCEDVTLSSTDYTTSFSELQSTQSQTRRIQIIPIGTVGNVTVSAKVFAANNSCSWFQNVLPGFSITSPQAVNFNYSNPSLAEPSESGSDLWYSFNPNSGTDNGLNVYSTSATITVSGLTTGQSIRVLIYKGTVLSSNNCANLSNRYISSIDFTSNGTATFNCLDEVHGITDGGYLVRIVQTSGAIASPSVTIVPSSAGKFNNSCINIWDGNSPKILGVSDALHNYNPFYILNGETKNGNFTGSTDCDSEITNSTCSDVSNNPLSTLNQRDLWYIFKVPNSTCPQLTSSSLITEMTLNYNAGNAFNDAKIYVYSSCDDDQLISCSPILDGAGTNWTVSGLTQGQYYLIRIKPSALNSNFDYPFSLSVSNGIARPCNNDAIYAQSLTINACNDYNSLPIYSMKGANPSPSTGVPENDVWFTFSSPSPANGGSYFNANKSWVTVFLENVSGTPTAPIYIQLYSDPFNIIATANTFETGTSALSQAFAHFGHLEPGQEYYLRIFQKELPTTEVNYKINVYTPNLNENAWGCGRNSSSYLSGCSEGCNDLRESWVKIDLPTETPSNAFYMIEVVGEDQILDFELRSQYLTESSANEGDYDDYDHPCASRTLESEVSIVSEVYGISSPLNGAICNTNGILNDGGFGVRRVYTGMNGPIAGMKDYYYIRIFMDPSDPNFSSCKGLKICSVNFYGPYSASNLANSGGQNDLNCTYTLLPTQLNSFDGIKNNGTSILTWQTKSEVNNSHFDIEYSSNGTEFEFVGKVPGNGNSNILNNYQFAHKSSDLKSYYRLIQVDINGGETISSIIMLEDQLDGITVYPNPIHKNEPLILQSKYKINSIEITNTLGQTIYNDDSVFSNQIVLEQLNSFGIFILKIKCEDMVFQFKILSN